MKNAQMRVIKQTFIVLYPKMMSLACRYVDDQTAKDLIQEVFLFFHERYDEFNAENTHAYLMRMLKNKCLNYLKHKNIEENYGMEVAIAEARSAFIADRTDDNEIYDHMDKIDLRIRLDLSVQKLPPKCQEAFRLHFFEELTYKEIGEKMHISHRTAEVHVQQALSFLKKDMKNIPLMLLFLQMLK